MNAIILCHRGAQAAIFRHQSAWSIAFDNLIFISPSDDWLPGSVAMGLCCRNGRGAIERILFAATMASRFEVACVMEYDTILPFEKVPDSAATPGHLVCSAIYENHHAELSAPVYGHSPWIARGEDWWKIVTNGGGSHGGWIDRWIAAGAHRAGIKLLGLDTGFSFDGKWDNKIRRAASASGAKIFHGAKTEEDWEACQANLTPTAGIDARDTRRHSSAHAI